MPTSAEGTLARRMGLESLRRIVYGRDAIRKRVSELGAEVTADYRNADRLLVLGLLKGSFIFLADLVRTIELPLQVDFLVASSYGSGTTSSGRVDFLYDPDTQISDRDVILVEDIVDSGATISKLLPILNERGPRSLEVCALLHKRRVTLPKEPRWVGFEAPQEFLVGYGLDHAEDFRHLPFIGCL